MHIIRSLPSLLPYTEVLRGIRYTMPDDIRRQPEQFTSELSSQ
jgi:hypothetical protein